MHLLVSRSGQDPENENRAKYIEVNLRISREQDSNTHKNMFYYSKKSLEGLAIIIDNLLTFSGVKLLVAFCNLTP